MKTNLNATAVQLFWLLIIAGCGLSKVITNIQVDATQSRITEEMGQEEHSTLDSPLNRDLLGQEISGQIIGHLASSNGFLGFELPSFEQTTLELPDEWLCDGFLIQYPPKAICSNLGQLYFIDLYSGGLTGLEIPTPDWISSTGNGKYLYYGYVQDQAIQRIEIYELDSRRVLASSTLDYSDWTGGVLSEIPGRSLHLSSDAKYFAIFRQHEGQTNSVTLIDTGTFAFENLDNRPIFTSGIGSGLAWSPSGRELLIGVGNGGEGGLGVSDLYVIDSSSGNPQTLTKPIGPAVYREFWNNHSWLPEINRIPSSHYLQQAWSTYADKFLMFYEEPVKNNGNIYWIKGICILGLGNYQPRCEPILYSDGRSAYNNVTNFIWSPDDKYIAFLAEKIGRWDIFVYDIEHDRYFLVATDTSVDGLYWGE